MEMNSSRGSSGSGTGRSIDRSRQPTAAPLKKPRLANDDADAIISKARAFPPRPGASHLSDLRLKSTSARERERENERERDDSVRGAHSYQQIQELVAQYTTALAELTFNSKPIITNLTIIAGENLHAAKWIADTICANILEVPSDQKLPSLYLLDSIVKNIGRDYIKYFAARLSEVFCKAYKQVDSSIHPGMRHLFGTWKGVFLPATLQFIEKNLGFSSAVNGSPSVGITSRTDSQTQRPPHSIHVNPKYLEARHLFPQSNKSKEASSKEDTIVDNVERPEITSATGSTRKWTDTSMKNIHHPLKELPKEHSPKKSPSLKYGENKFGSDLSRYSSLKMGRSNKAVTEQTGLDAPWYDSSRRSPEVSINQRNKSDIYAQGSHIISRSLQSVDQQLTVNQNFTNKRTPLLSRNWKNSEEEEYMWDDTNSKSSDRGMNFDSAKVGWVPTDIKKDDTHWNKLDPYSQLEKPLAENRASQYRDIEEQCLQSPAQYDSSLSTYKEDSSDSLTMGGSSLGKWTSSKQYQEPQLDAVFGQTSISSRFSGQAEGQEAPISSGFPATMRLPSENTGLHAHEGLPAVVATSGIGSSSFSHSAPSLASVQNPKPHGQAVHEYQQPQQSPQRNKEVHIVGQLSHIVPLKPASDSLSTIPSSFQQSYTHPNLQTLSQGSHHIDTLSASSKPSDMRKYPGFLQQPPSDNTPQHVEAQSRLSPDTWRQSNEPSAPTGSNHPEVDISGQSSASSLLAAIMKSGLFSNNPASTSQNLNIDPPLPSGPPPIQITASTSSHQSCSTSETIVINSSPLTTTCTRVMQPPLPPGPPPSSALAISTTNTVGKNSAPLSDLLNSLVAKGLISSSADEPRTKSEVCMPHQSPSESTHPSTSALHASVPDGSGTPSSVGKPSLPEHPQVKDVAMAQHETTNSRDLIGLQFKPEVMRSLHTVVIDSLFDDLKCQCRMCGLRFQLQDQLTKHIGWHDDTTKLDSFTSNRASRRWYMNSSFSASNVDIEWVEQTDGSQEKCEPTVTADESQSICALCGEPFEDFYCHVRDEWMYRGTAYMKQSVDKGNPSDLDGSGIVGIIVHAKCMQRLAGQDDVKR